MKVFLVVNNFFILLSSLDLIGVSFSPEPFPQSLPGASLPVKILSHAPQHSELLFHISTLIYLALYFFSEMDVIV